MKIECSTFKRDAVKTPMRKFKGASNRPSLKTFKSVLTFNKLRLYLSERVSIGTFIHIKSLYESNHFT